MVRFNHVLAYIASRRFAVILLILTTTVILIGNLIPSPVLMSQVDAERFVAESPFLHKISNIFHVMNITKSPFFLIIPAFIVASIFLCTIKRLRAVRAVSSIPSPDHLRFRYSMLAGARDGIGETLKGMGWELALKEYPDGDLIYGRKGEKGIWGSFLFHAGMIIVIAGALVSMLTLVNGKIALTEGMEAGQEELLVGFDKITGFPYQAMLLESFDATYTDSDFPVDYTAVVNTLDENKLARKEVIKVNQPMRSEGYQFLLHQASVSPRFIITDQKGEVIQDAYINLLVPQTDIIDGFDIADIGVSINVRFFPDFYKEGERIGTRSRNIENPVFYLEFFKWDRKLGGGFLHLNKRMDFDEGRYTIELRDLRKWVILVVSKDPGLPLVELGLFLVVAGLVARFLINEKRIWVLTRRDVDTVELGGRALYFPFLFEEELRKMAGELGFETD